MKIDSAAIRFSSHHVAKTRHEKTESLESWVGQRPPRAGEARAAPRPLATNATPPSPPPCPPDEPKELEWADADPRARVLIMMIEKFTGHKIRLLSLKDVQPDAPELDLPSNGASAPTAPPAQQGWGVEYHYHELVHEEEATNFAAGGVVRTADGKEIQFSYALDMKRSYTQETNLDVYAGDAKKKDPLVINFTGSAAQLTDERFQFDLDVDGQQDSIAFLRETSGFVALDRNGNGAIDDGSELFGAQSGNGFADLAAYDSDANHWIDEQDPIYAQLRVWTKDAQGKDALTTLTQRNVGAIYLESQRTPFALRGSGNQDLGDVRSTGVYLTEQGQLGSVQQIDLAV